MNEIWSKILDARIPNARYELTKLDYNGKGIVLTLDDEINQLIIEFKIAISLRLSDEGDRMRTMHNVIQKMGKNFFADYPLYKVDKSEYFKWICDERYGDVSFVANHYAIVTPNDIIDILSTFEPTIEIYSVDNVG